MINSGTPEYKNLFLGTVKDNADDCRSKNRQAPTDQTRQVGVKNGRAKLSEADVRAIRAAYDSAPRKKRIRRGTLTELSAQFGVSTMMIYYVGTRKFWRELEEV
jgi:hypothetical protein